jgi:hypothetical protein
LYSPSLLTILPFITLVCLLILVGVALLGGIITCVNRRGGCGRGGAKKRSDFEDYGLADTDFPHKNQPTMQSVGLATNAAAIGSATPVLGAISPTVPHLNDQGTYYSNAVAEDPYGAQQQQQQQQQQQNTYAPAYPSHSDVTGINSVATGDYNNVGQAAMDYNAQQQQPYYYQQDAAVVTGAVGGYYDESGYYYESHNQQQLNINSSHAASYDMAAQYNGNQAYSTNTPQTGGDGYYKPDQRL